ncbi:MAG TPA: hypothetical protein DCR93_20065, partial [Cytophagales bacterium]|nr:hypothetical protein [Cytophagales bacterium]
MAQKGYQLRNDVNYQEGVIRIKFQEHQAAALDALMKGQRTVQSRAGVLETGFAAVDAVNATIGATEMKRVFRPAGKFEARHRQWGLHLWYEVTYTSDQQLQEVLNAYAGASELAIVEPKEEYSLVDSYNPMAERSAAVANYDVEVIPGGTPNDPSYGQQWGWPAINAAQAWELETGHTSVVVAIEDQGVDYNHPDLNGNMWTNTGETPGNGVDDDGNGYVDDYYGYNFGNDNGNIAIDYHGTHVGGTVAAETNNGVGVAGAAGGSGSNDGVRLMTLSVFGSGAQAGFDEAFIYAADMGAAISQNSWGGGSQSSALENAIDYFRANGGGGVMDGGLVVFAAGNSNSSSTSVGYPASYAPCLAVASIASNLVRSSFSNYGSWVDISAPGSAIYSTYPVSQGSYNSISGTSMACPHVSGVAALVVSNKVRNGESITDEQLWDLLVDNADPSLYNTNGSFSGQLGSGMLDAYASLTGTPPPPPVCYGGGSVISSFPYAESFESGTGAWQQTTCDDIDWTRDASGTPSRNTGPSSGSAGSYYMYVEASSPNYPDKTSNLYANVDLTGSSSATLGFDYHSYGTAADVTLALQVSTNGGTSFSTAWSMTGNQGNQ